MSDLLIDYNDNEKRAIISVAPQQAQSVWFQSIVRSLEDNSNLVITPRLGLITVPWWVFLSIRQGIGAILKNAGVGYEISDKAKSHLRKSAENQRKLLTTSTLLLLTEEQIKQKLMGLGWLWETRSLTKEQMRNVMKLSALPSGATFSVPGAGKTTEALAYYFLRSTNVQGLLVVAPKNAFTAWEEQLEICMGEKYGRFVRLTGGESNIEALLITKPRFMLITYHQLSRVADMIGGFLSENETHMYLDESHKIKAGSGRVTVDAVLSLSHLPVGKLILSGTPMPQSVEDLIPQFNFIYPEVQTFPESVIEAIRPVFVRTTKKELNLPAVQRHKIPVPFNQAQKRLYDLMRSEIVREAEVALNQRTKLALRALGRSVIRLIEVVSNPALLAGNLTFLHQDLLSEVLDEGGAPKIQYACERARLLARKGKKTLIWTTFRKNVESMADRLRDLKAVYIHGGVDTGEEDDNETREGRIKEFRNNPGCFVMVANPAAAAEGISLHKICHHAVYVDRTYNAAHYLQSEDRLHRLGLLPEEAPIIEILQCPGSIDESIDLRLRAKVDRMSKALNDPSLNIDAEQYVPFDIDDDPESQSSIIDSEDVHSILASLRGE